MLNKKEGTMTDYDKATRNAASMETEICKLAYNITKVSSDQIAQNEYIGSNEDISICSTLAMAFLGRAMALTPDGCHSPLISTIIENAGKLADAIVNVDRQVVIDDWLEIIKKQSGGESQQEKD
jgi:hypothetical protein